MTKPDIAVIAGAGWKPFNEWKLAGKWRNTVPPRTPELLWPLPNGETVLSRYVKQLKSLGVREVIACIGKPGCNVELVERRHKRKFGFELEGYGKPVWTNETAAYVSLVGATPFFLPNPHAPGQTCWQTLGRAFSELLHDQSWERVISLSGDYVLETAWLSYAAETAAYPSQVWMLPRHSIEFLNRFGVVAIINYWDSFSKLHQGTAWANRRGLELRGVGMRYIWDFPDKKASPEKWREVVDKRRAHFCEAGPGEYPFAWELARRDPI